MIDRNLITSRVPQSKTPSYAAPHV